MRIRYVTALLACTLVAGCDQFARSLNGEASPPDLGVFSEGATPVTTHHYPGDVDVAIERTSSQTISAITVIGAAPAMFFNPGSYTIDPGRMRASDRQFATQLKAYAGQLVAGMDAATQRIRVKCTYTGATDSTPVREGLVYKGEFGRVQDEVSWGGQRLTVTVNPGSRVVQNIELAVLRAHNLQAALKSLLPEQVVRSAENVYAVDLSNRPGARFRYAKVRVELVPLGPES